MTGTSRSDAPATREPSPFGIREPVLFGGILVLCGLVLLPLLGFGFVHDDGWTLTANGFLRDPDLALLFSPEAAARHVPDAFRPTLVTFDVLTYQLLGLWAGAHHALSIALHLAVCWLAQRWLQTLGAPVGLRAATMGLFGLLAVHAEAIAVISFREDLLAAALGLGALQVASAAIRRPSGEGPRARWRHMRDFALAALLMALACGAKMSAAALPALWWLAESLGPWSPPTPRRARIAGGLALALGVGLAIGQTLLVFGALSPYGADNLRLYAARVGLGPVLARSTQIHLSYLQQIALPFGLSPEYVDAGAEWDAPATLLALGALAGLLLYGLAGAAGRRRPLAALAILGAFALALPTSNLAAMPNMQADRLIYLSSLPVCLGLAALLVAAGERLQRATGRAALGIAPIAAMMIVQGSVLQATARVYRSNGALWAAASRLAPGSARAQALHGEVLLGALSPEDRGSDAYRRALTQVRGRCRGALALDPLDELAHLCAARLAIEEEAWADAEASLERALALSHDRNHRILAALAQVRLDVPIAAGRGGVDDEAERRRRSQEVVERAIREYPYAVEVWAAAGRIHHRLGDAAAAEAAYDRAYALAPERWETSLWTVELAVDRGDLGAALQLLRARARALEAADPVAGETIERRVWDLARLFSPSLVHSASDPSGARFE